ncbi:hypothetical protein [Klebsiella michiganensis]|uniref:hypothetical protein n=1 Tax=Klebsiella michiganensis TaxID=1134687 RepID=UPI001E48C503|nr:hypothetical protein [Klebsiella michiganensis]UHC85231.1 hypothetical protein LUW95_14885 [Klebsiella michiganensis]HEL6475469.1 hypothetical protein [Klebsiella pneumoniae]
MTDITELAHREKFEAWWERTQHNGNPPRFGWSHWRDGEGYKVDDDNSELDGMWSAWKAAGAELVEALEKAQQRIDSQREYYDGVIADGGKRIAELESRTVTIEPFRSFVTDADLAALHRFAECCDDPESGGHDLEKEQVRRLEAIGALQRSGRISYITGFGDVLISITAGIKVEAE